MEVFVNVVEVEEAFERLFAGKFDPEAFMSLL